MWSIIYINYAIIVSGVQTDIVDNVGYEMNHALQLHTFAEGMQQKNVSNLCGGAHIYGASCM